MAEGSLDPSTIIVRDRQRSEAPIDDHFVASVTKRLIHPIVLRREDGEPNPILVAGGRRLAGLMKGGVTELHEGIHFRYFDSLDPLEAKAVELEENVKRTDLPWRDQVTATGQLHELYTKHRPGWNLDKTASEVSLSRRWLQTVMIVYKKLDSPLLKDATSIPQAHSILQTAAERRSAEIINRIANVGNQVFNGKDAPHVGDPSPLNSPDIPRHDPNGDNPIDLAGDGECPVDPGSDGVQQLQPKPEPATDRPPVIQADFISWAGAYTGPKFTVLHVDFPYDVDYSQYAKSVTSTDEDYAFEGYSNLLNALCGNVDRLLSYSSHMIFWFSMEFYQTTYDQLAAAGFWVHRHPLFWHKTDNAGIIPGRDNQWPRRVYETAFLCSRGKRPLIKSLSNAYGAPTTPNPLHPSHKPEPMLRHFLSMVIDETTDVLDPTCGSGSAIRAAEDCGARSVLGLELSEKYAEAANAQTLLARGLRKVAQK